MIMKSFLIPKNIKIERIMLVKSHKMGKIEQISNL